MATCRRRWRRRRPRLRAAQHLLALACVGLAPSSRAAAPPPPAAQLRVAVSELFRDIFSVGEDDSSADPRLACKPDVRAAPWLAWPELAGTWHSQTGSTPPASATAGGGAGPPVATLLPPMRALNSTILSAAHLFDPTRRLCAGDARVARAGAAPAGFCVDGIFPPHTMGYLFDQFAHEHHVLSRWLQRTDLVCGAGARSLAELRARASSERAWCDAHVVLVPSLAFHYHAIGGAYNFTAMRTCFTHPLYYKYWIGVHDLFHRAPLAARGRGHRLVVVVEPYAWNGPPQLRNLRMMALLPEGLRSRLLVGTTMSSMALSDMASLDPLGRAGWRAGAEEELERRERLLGNALARGRRLSSFCGGPLFVTLPQTVGVARALDWTAPQRGPSPAATTPHTPRPIALLYDASATRDGKDRFSKMQYARPLLEAALRRSGRAAKCGKGPVVLCARAGSNDCCAHRRPLYEALARATLTLEPPGDTLGRSHAYAAALAGALPVLVEGGHRSYNESEPTWWPWRAARREGRRAARPARRPAAPATLSLDYDRFSVLLSAAEVRADASGAWVRALLDLSADAARLHAMRVELRRAAPFFTYLPHDCPADSGRAPGPGLAICDAVSAFDAIVARAWVASARLAAPPPLSEKIALRQKVKKKALNLIETFGEDTALPARLRCARRQRLDRLLVERAPKRRRRPQAGSLGR